MISPIKRINNIKNSQFKTNKLSLFLNLFLFNEDPHYNQHAFRIIACGRSDCCSDTTDLYDKSKMCVTPLTMTLVYKDKNQKQVLFNDSREMFPEMKWIKVLHYLFKSITSLTISLRKIIVDAERMAFKTGVFYHRCVLKDNISQSKLKSLQKRGINTQLIG